MQSDGTVLVEALQFKFAKLPGIKAYTVFSEELGIQTFPAGAAEADADLVVFIDPIDGTEFVEALQGGWSLIAVYDRRCNEVIAAVAGDIFLDRLYWASASGYPECLDFITHSWFRLDGGREPKASLAGARVNVLTTKVDRYRALSEQTALLNAIRETGNTSTVNAQRSTGGKGGRDRTSAQGTQTGFFHGRQRREQRGSLPWRSSVQLLCRCCSVLCAFACG